MRTPQERQSDVPTSRSEGQGQTSATGPVGEGGTRQSSQQGVSGASTGDVARQVPSATEPRGSRVARQGWSGQLRSGYPASPWDLMRSMSEEIDRLWDNFAGVRGGASPFGLTTQRALRGAPGVSGREFSGVWSPQIEILQKPNALLLQADLPGLKPDDVDVNVEDGMLTISGERKQEQKDEGEGFWRSERSYGAFYRAIPLPDGADEEKIAASFKNGVLEVNIPLTGKVGGRKIKIG